MNLISTVFTFGIGAVLLLATTFADDFFQQNKVIKLSDPYAAAKRNDGAVVNESTNRGNGVVSSLATSSPSIFKATTTAERMQQSSATLDKSDAKTGNNMWDNNVGTLVNRLPLAPMTSFIPLVPTAINSPQYPFVYQAAQPIVHFPVPILIFENQIKNLIIQGRLSSGRNGEKIDLRDEQFVDHNVGDLLASINVFDQMVSMSKYSNDSTSA